MKITRREAVLGIGALLATGVSACHRVDDGSAGVLRVGYLANVTHSPLIAGVASGRIAKAIAPIRLETRVFRAGPSVVEALLSKSIDLGTSGPAPVVITQARYGDGTLEVESGCASGGASLVIRNGIKIETAADLRGKSLASPQIGCTQDISLRKYLRAAGLDSTDRGGDVKVYAFAPATILAEMRRGEIDGAWLPEPWATRMVKTIGATRFVDERDLWPNHEFSSALVVTRPQFRAARSHDMDKLMAAIAEEIERAKTQPDLTREEAFNAIDKLTGAGPKDIFAEAWSRVSFTKDPLRDAVLAFAGDARDLGMLPKVPGPALFV
jgi:NitT/TauT family transport system substrate-binding protein